MDLLRASTDFAGQGNGISPTFDFQKISDVNSEAIHQAFSSSEQYSDSNFENTWTDTVGEDVNGNVPSLSDYMRDNPGATYEDMLKYMSQWSDEWAEKYLDYLTSRGEIDRANEYNASREDTAYQRLVEDLKKAGLNPAMMYGNSASPVGTASSGVYDPNGSASNSRISNLSKIKTLLLNSVLAQWQIQYQTTQNNLKGIDIISKLFGKLLTLGVISS